MARNDLLSGFQVGASIGDSISRGMLQREMLKRQKRRDEIEGALLQLKNPGLKIAGESDLHGQESLEALPVGQESDRVEMLAPGVMMNRGEADRLDQAMFDRERRQRRFALQDELEARSTFADGAARKEFDRTLQLKKIEQQLALERGDEAAARQIENELKLLDRKKEMGLFDKTTTGKVPKAKFKYETGVDGIQGEMEIPINEVPDNLKPPSMRSTPPPSAEELQYQAELEALDREIAKHRSQIAQGDTRTGWFNLRSRENQVKDKQRRKAEIEKLLSGKKDPGFKTVDELYQ